jgi:hypothetical protein
MSPKERPLKFICHYREGTAKQASKIESFLYEAGKDYRAKATVSDGKLKLTEAAIITNITQCLTGNQRIPW